MSEIQPVVLEYTYVYFEQDQKFVLYINVPELFFNNEYNFILENESITIYRENEKYITKQLPLEINDNLLKGKIDVFLTTESLSDIFKIPNECFAQ